MKIVLKNDAPFVNEVQALVEGLGYKLVDYSLDKVRSSKVGAWHANVVIFSPNGTGIQDCSTVHKPLQQRLEVLLNTDNLSMEVSSPGINRVLKKSYEFTAFVGQVISVWDATCTDWIKGTLSECSDSDITVETEAGTRKISFENCKKAKLE